MKGLVNDIGKKKLIIILGAFVGFIILVIVLLLVIHSMSGKTLSYKQIESKLTEAAKKYYSKNKDLLPQNDGGQVTVDDTTLSSSDYLKPLSELVSDKEGISCTGKVLVNYRNSKYRYVPLLDCGDAYKTETLVSYIKKNEPKVFEGEGLYDMNSELVYRGENPNNYIQFSGKIYRIVKIVDDKAVLILQDKFERSTWDNRYNIDRNGRDGINDYSVSRVKTNLATILEEEKLISNDDKMLLAIHDLYVGKRGEEDSYNDGTLEKSMIDKDQYIGLLPLYDYLNASIDSLCRSAKTRNCSNYNYLDHFDYVWWLMTGDSNYSHKVFRATGGSIDSYGASNSYYLRPVIMLTNSALYAGGTGTEADPYLVK